jgi:small subunit ribosomal protein S21
MRYSWFAAAVVTSLKVGACQSSATRSGCEESTQVGAASPTRLPYETRLDRQGGAERRRRLRASVPPRALVQKTEKRPAHAIAKKPLTETTQLGLLTGFSFNHSSATSVQMSIEIKIRKNEPIDRALRRMKKKLDRENIIKGTRAKRYFEKPCEKRRRKEKVQAFTQMLRRRYAE